MSELSTDDCIDLTDEVAAAGAANTAAAASPSLTPKQLMQQKLMQSGGGWSRTKTAAAAVMPASAAAAAASSSPSRLQMTPVRAQPRLQLSSIPHTPPDLLHSSANSTAAASSQSTAASSSAATVAPRVAGSARLAASNRLFGASQSSIDSGSEVADAKPMRLSQLLSQAPQPTSAASSITNFLLPQPFSRVAAAAQPSESAAAKYKREPGTAPPPPAAAANAPFSFTPPASSSTGDGHGQSSMRAPLSAPPMHGRTSAAAAASSTSLLPRSSATPLRNASGATLQESEDEQLVRRRKEIDAELHELDEQILAIQTRQRHLKNERREVQGRLDRPVQVALPFTSTRALAPTVGGASSLLSGSDFWKGQFDWDEAARQTMQSVFGLSSYRVSQREVINATMSRKDCFVVMPTGAGKSLLYQLPSVLNEGVTLVISPLLSLMEDQLIYLRSVGIDSYMLCGTTSKQDAAHVHAQMTDPHSPMRLLYVTPEKIAKSKQFLSKLERMGEMGKLSRIVIDEVHCCSQWGHDFRPDYRKLSVLKTQFPEVPILAVTATATDKVARDCISILKIQGCQQFKCSFNRPNLHYSVRDKSGTNQSVAEDMHRFIVSIGHLRSSGIVYCYSKKETMEVCSQLSALGISCDFYNSDVTPEHRQLVHHRWVKGQIKVVVATNAFGLGINKPDVRFVLHHTIPQSIETYAQESGRAGRDGLPSHCCLWYSPRDLPRQSIRVYANQDMTSHLYPMVSYCHQLDQCRRVAMSRHFGEAFQVSQCNRMCDVCELTSAAADSAPGSAAAAAGAAGSSPRHGPAFITRDLTEAAIQLCDFVATNGGGAAGDAGGKGKGKRKRSSIAGANITQKQLVDELRKKNSSITLPKGMSRDDCERLIIELMLQGILKETFKNTAYTTISYIKTDPHLSQQLRSGDLLIQLRFVDPAVAKQHAAEAGGPTPKRRASSAKKGGTVKAERGAKAEAASAAAAAASSSSAAAAADEEDDFDLDEDDTAGDDFEQYGDAEAHGRGGGDDEESEAFEVAGARPRRRSSVAGARSDGDDDFDLGDDASSEDVPIKKTRREPTSARLQQQAQARAPRRSASAQQHSYQEDDGFEILPDTDEEDAFRQTLEQSMHDF